MLSGFGSSGRQSIWSAPGWPRVSEQSKNKFGDWGAGGLKTRNSVFYLSHSFVLLMNHQLVWFRLIHVTDQLQDLQGQCYHVINHLVLFKLIYFIVNFSILLICVIISSDVIGKTMSKKPQDFSQVAKCPFATLANLGVLLFLNLWAILNQYLLQNKHASISSFQGRIFKKSRQTTFFLDPSPVIFPYVWLFLSMSICVVWPVSNHHLLSWDPMDTIFSPFPGVDQKYGPRLFPHLASRIHRVHYGLLDEERNPQNLRRTWLFWCNPVLCLRRCWGVMIKHVYQIISVYPMPVDVFWWSSAVCVDSNQVVFLAS